MPPTFHVANYNRYTPTVSWCPVLVSTVWPLGPPKDADFFRLKKAVSGVFLINPFFQSNGWLPLIACHTYLEILCVSGPYWAIWNQSQCILRSFAGKLHLHFYNIWDLVVLTYNWGKYYDLFPVHQLSPQIDLKKISVLCSHDFICSELSR